MKTMKKIYLVLSAMAGIVILSVFYMTRLYLVDLISPEFKNSAAFRSLSTMSLSKIDYYSQLDDLDKSERISSGKYSTIQLVNNQSIFTIGQTVELDIDLFDQQHMHALEGGDILRIWGDNSKIGASCAGTVIDQGRGKYTGYLKLLWTGRTNIHVMLAVTKGQVAFYLRKLATYGMFRSIQAMYLKSSGKNTFASKRPCSTVPIFPGNPNTCNFTHLNFGIPWYCGHPGSNFSCDDWKSYSQYVNNSYEKKFIRLYGYQRLDRTITVHANGEKDRLPGQLMPCTERQIKMTWHEDVPTGYFFRDKWYSLYCADQLTRDKTTYLNCLKHRIIQFYGDSTTRQWFSYLHTYLNMSFKIGGPIDVNDKSWHRYSYSIRNDLNISLSWAPHSLPFFGSEIASVSNIRSVGWYLDQIPENSNAVIVLHWFIHLALTTRNSFRIHLQNTVTAIKKLLKRAPNAKIFLKGPHAFSSESSVTFPVDFVKQYQQQILYEEFKDLRDKVIYVDEWDITVSTDNYSTHPPERTIKEMVNHMMSYVCRHDTV